MEIIVLDKIKTEHMPSGSGIVKHNDTIYIIGDDSPYLFSLDNDFNLVSKTQLIDTFNVTNNRIIKSEKPDFEAFELIGTNELVIFGSGSKTPQRNSFIRVLLNDEMRIEKYDISNFYNELKKLPSLKNAELNIEASAFYDGHIFLLNRSNNLILQFEYANLLRYFKGEAEFPKPEVKAFTLPKIYGIEAGFSGATALKNEPKLIFTASVENTENAYDDGEILGSIIGIIDITNNSLSDSFTYCEIPSSDEHLKVESVTVENEISHGETKVVLITDDDKGNSIIIKGVLLW